jgi:hypothetical protein
MEYKEGYLGTAKVFVGSARLDLQRKVHVTFLSQIDKREKIHCFASPQELRHAAKMFLEAAEQSER